MNPLLTVLTKGLVLPFYRIHAGLLLFVFFIMFGMVESNQLVNYHRTLIEGMFSAPIFMLGVFAVWMLYSLKILFFMISLLKQSKYTFLNNLTLLSKAKVFILLLTITCLAFLPVLTYSIFIYWIGISQHHYFSSVCILLIQLSLCSINVGILVFFLSTQHRFSWSIPHVRLPNITGRLGFYINYFINYEKISLLISKIFSLGLLYMVREVSEAGDDFRIFGIAWLFALLAQSFLMLKVRVFEDTYLLWVKNLPIRASKTFGIYFLFYSGLMLPELILLITSIGKGITVFDLGLLLLLSGGLLTFIHTYLLKPGRNPDQYSVFLFWLFMLSFIFILSKLIIVLVIICCAMSYLRFTKRYYEYEPLSFS